MLITDTSVHNIHQNERHTYSQGSAWIQAQR